MVFSIDFKHQSHQSHETPGETYSFVRLDGGTNADMLMVRPGVMLQ